MPEPAAVKIIFCPECGGKAMSTSKFCTHCGHELYQKNQLSDDQLKKLKDVVGSLREILGSTTLRTINPNAQRDDEDKLFDQFLEMEHPEVVQRRIKWGKPNHDGGYDRPGGIIGGMNDDIKDAKIFRGQYQDRPIGLGGYLKYIDPQNVMKVHKAVREYIEKITLMSEGTDAQGGYAVPVEYANEIIKLERDNSIARQLCRIFPMVSLTRKVPRQLTQPTVTWTDEATAKTKTKPTLEQLTQTAKKLAAVVAFTDELLEDNNVDLDKFVMELIAESMGIEEDRVIFAGRTAGGDPFNGVLYAAGVNVVTMAGASVTHDDLIDVAYTVNAKYRQNARYVTSTTGLRVIMKLKDANGNYLWQKADGGQPARIWEFEYEISDQIPTNLGAGANETAILFGNWKKYVWISDRGGYEVKSSISASDFATSESAFMNDETWYRFKKRMSLDVALPAAMTRMTFK